MPRPRSRTSPQPARAILLNGRMYPAPSEEQLIERARAATAKLRMGRLLTSLGVLPSKSSDDEDDDYLNAPLTAEELRLQAETRAQLAAIRKPFVLPSGPSKPQALVRLDAQPSELPSGDETLARLLDYLREHDADFGKLPAADQHTRALALRDALRAWTGSDKSAALSRGNGTASKPLLLLSVWPGRNRTEQCIAMLCASQPSLRRSPWERLVTLAGETLAMLSDRVI